ncbi:phospholipase D-like domain-containing protein [Caballeronia sp. SEWSISQ10-4 2]|uniref:phospholipase D-like domain-containing protein n=1 Tax=Caballeronia sp. SEWSISQ10-4 2 TaxID=2937438 RepID=UPI00264D3C21|nr:phospholipase D-like domain-containing protein [Caballeronia sp. SEWSISQ10-4 2]MDN7179283.1 phospholipase D-like domain-containing protein [Caballeronia sp. SEWSISQ10-4 2]
MADSPLKTHQPANVAIDEQSRMAKGSVQWLLEKREKIPITKGNTLSFMICGEDGFKSIAKDLREAKASADIICWGFDPGMELERSGDTWPRGVRFGELLDTITTRMENPVTVRLLIWYDALASNKQNNVPGYSDHVSWNPNISSPYADEARQKYCIDWWARNLPKGSNSGLNPRLRVVLRSVGKDDVVTLMSADPLEEDQPVSTRSPITDEKRLLEDYATHHQKPILIDYEWDNGSKAVGYVMGLNSVTDFWDKTAHVVDDPKRETWAKYLIETDPLGAELGHEKDTEGASSKGGNENYRHAKPYQDYACRIVGPALAQLHFNFENGWSAALGAPCPMTSPPAPPAKIPTQWGHPAHLVQIVRTQAHEKEKSIKEVYFQASSSARNYIYIENQYFFYPEFARHLKKTRMAFCRDWSSRSGKPLTEMPKLHLFIVIPHPENDHMVPRTFDMLSELGASSAMPNQGKVAAAGKLDHPYPDSHKGPKGGQVLDRPSVQDLERTLGLEVSVARLRTSGPDADGNMAYREIYIHSKLMLIDDVFVTLGSANLNQRSMSVDSEINIAATGQIWAADLRQRVFALHSDGDIQGSGDPAEIPQMFEKWNKQMSKNRDAQLAGVKPMKGFILPFEDQRQNTTLYGSIDVPSSANTEVT